MSEPEPDPAAAEHHFDVMLLTHEEELPGVLVAQAYSVGGQAGFHSLSGLQDGEVDMLRSHIGRGDTDRVIRLIELAGQAGSERAAIRLFRIVHTKGLSVRVEKYFDIHLLAFPTDARGVVVARAYCVDGTVCLTGEGDLLPGEAEVIQQNIAARVMNPVSPGFVVCEPPLLRGMVINRRHFRAVSVANPKEWAKGGCP